MYSHNTSERQQVLQVDEWRDGTARECNVLCVEEVMKNAHIFLLVQQSEVV